MRITTWWQGLTLSEKLAVIALVISLIDLFA